MHGNFFQLNFDFKKKKKKKKKKKNDLNSMNKLETSLIIGWLRIINESML